LYNYAFKKLVHSLIVLLSVISAVYLFQSYSVIDPVDDFMSSSFGERPVHKKDFEKAYTKEAIRQNKHLPKFYFDIIPSYFPDTLHKIILHDERSFLTQAIRYSKCIECSTDFIQRQKGLQDVGALDSLVNIETKSILSKISREKDLNKLAYLFSSLKTGNIHDIPAINELIESFEKLSQVKNSFTFPKLVIHGFKNQFHLFVTGIFTGKMGISKADGRTANSKIIKALKWTLSLNVISFIIAGGLGLFLGLWSIKNDDSKKEKYASSAMFFVYTMPVFWTATLMVVFFTTDRYGAWTNIFPSTGIKYWYADKSVSEQILLNFSQLTLPIICIILPSLAYMSRIMKSKFSEVLSSDFITALKAKGISQKRMYNKHVLKNGMIPYITILTGSLPGLFAGSLVIEIIFSIPGIGKLLFDSIYISDWNVISGLVIMMSLVTILAYFLADILYSWVNPKIALE